MRRPTIERIRDLKAAIRDLEELLHLNRTPHQIKIIRQKIEDRQSIIEILEESCT